MVAGLPGTGIGGIFYLLIALAMPVRQLGLKVVGRARHGQWPVIALAVGMVVGIVSGIWAEMALLDWFWHWLTSFWAIKLHSADELTVQQAPLVTLMVATAGFISLGWVYLMVRVLGLIFRPRGEPRPQPQIEPATNHAAGLVVWPSL